MQERTGFCPRCGESMDSGICPTDGIPTVDLVRLAEGTADVEPGVRVADGRYRIVRVLGGGAMGRVYEAEQLSMDRPVALKLLRPSASVTAADIRRFFREAQAASRLRHPNVVDVYDFGVDAELRLPYLAMALVPGRSLRDLISADAPVAPARTAALLAQVARALGAAHEAGVVHRDLKPENIMVTVLPDGTEHVQVLDFGIAKLAATELEGGDNLTGTGFVVGTPRYMSPEQARGDAVDGRSDLYSLGCILHELLCGRPAFGHDQVVQLILAHAAPERPAYPVALTSSTPLVDLHRQLLQLDPNGRPQSAHELARVLDEVAGAQPLQLQDGGLSATQVRAEHAGVGPSGTVLRSPGVAPAGVRRAVAPATSARANGPERTPVPGRPLAPAVILVGLGAVAWWVAAGPRIDGPTEVRQAAVPSNAGSPTRSSAGLETDEPAPSDGVPPSRALPSPGPRGTGPFEEILADAAGSNPQPYKPTRWEEVVRGIEARHAREVERRRERRSDPAPTTGPDSRPYPLDVKLRPGDVAPMFKLRSLDQSLHRLSDYAGKRRSRRYKRHPVLLDFFRTDCEPCKKAMPELVEMHEKYDERGLKVILVALLEQGDTGRGKLVSYLDRVKLPFIVVVDGNDFVIQKYIGKKVSLPATFLIDPDGIVVDAKYDARESMTEAFGEDIERLVSATP